MLATAAALLVRRVEALLRLVEDAGIPSGVVAAGGARLRTCGVLFAPKVLINVPVQADIPHSEPFGPSAPLLSFKDGDEMLHQANGQFGPSAYVLTHDATRLRRLADALDCGWIGINNVETLPPEVPLTGGKEGVCGIKSWIEVPAP